MNYELVLVFSGVQEFRSSGVQPIPWGVIACAGVYGSSGVFSLRT